MRRNALTAAAVAQPPKNEAITTYAQITAQVGTSATQPPITVC